MNDQGHNAPYWWDEAAPRAGNTASPPAQAEVVIIGAGLTGLAAALPLARAGKQVVVLDKMRIGEAASSRNGGITSGNLHLSRQQLIRRFGLSQADAVEAEAVAARANLAEMIRDENLSCGHQPSGRVIGYLRPIDADAMRLEADRMNHRYNIEMKVLDQQQMTEHTASQKYQAGVLRPDIGSIHPGQLLLGLADRVEQAGGAIITETAITRVQLQNSQFLVETHHGNITADHVIVATNGYTDKGLPWLRRRLIPVISEIIVTEDLGANRVRALMPKLNMFGEALHLGYYYRPTPDGRRVLLGGRRYSQDPLISQRQLTAGLIGIFPDLGDVRITHHWSGPVAFPFDKLPKLVVNHGVIYAAGLCGSGTVWAPWLGKKAAAMILGEDSETIFAHQRMRSLPFYHGTPWFLPLTMQYYRLRDRMAAKSK